MWLPGHSAIYPNTNTGLTTFTKAIFSLYGKLGAQSLNTEAIVMHFERSVIKLNAAHPFKNPGFTLPRAPVSCRHLHYMSILLVSVLKANSLCGWLTSAWPLIFTPWPTLATEFARRDQNKPANIHKLRC